MADFQDEPHKIFIEKKVSQHFDQIYKDLLNQSVFRFDHYGNFSTSSSILPETPQEQALTFEKMKQVLESLPPMPEPLSYNLLRVSSEGLENLIEKTGAEYTKEEYGVISLLGIPIQISESLPDDVMLGISPARRLGDIPKVTAIINLGPRIRKIEFDENGDPITSTDKES